jgi:DNA ligase (NAD+)
MENYDKVKALSRIKELIVTLNEAIYAYEVEDNEIISNKEYDALFDELKALEAQTDIVFANSPTQRVGHKIIDKLPKVRHSEPMLSLDKTKEVPDIKKWLGKKVGVLSWKMDGLTIVLTYENGILVSAVTRGDGEIGQDIIHNIIAFKNIPSTIPYKGKLEIRGEAVISNANFEKINDAVVLAGGKPFATARNLASGSVKLLDSKTTQQRHLEFFAFQLVDSSLTFIDKVEQMIVLEQQGFSVVEYTIVDEICVEEVIKDFTKKAENFEYPVDGLVFTYNDIDYCNSLDTTSHHPLHSMAFKWADEVYKTSFEYIDYNTTRTGIISQTAVFEMVEIDGTEVRRALIPNLDYFNKLKLGKGDIIEVFKANMIKPEIYRNVTMSGTEKLIEECPTCGGSVIIDGKFLKCANPDCSAKIVNKLKHFVSRDCMNIEGVSIATLEKFVEKGWITTFGDIYRLSDHEAEIKVMDGFGKRSYEKMIKGIEASKTIAFQNFVNALGIKLVGLSTAKDLSKAYNNDIKLLVKTTWGDLHKISGIGGETAQAIHDYFKNAENLVMINDLLQYVTIETPAPVTTATDQRFKGMTFVITGTLSKDRNHFKGIIEGYGGKTSDSVSGKTSYLLAGEKAGSKLEKASSLGVKVLTEIDFEDLIK